MGIIGTSSAPNHNPLVLTSCDIISVVQYRDIRSTCDTDSHVHTPIRIR